MLSRREFVAIPAMAAGAAVSGFAQPAPLTAGQVVDRIRQNLGVPWREGPTDTFKVGDASSPVTGIATTVMSAFEVVKRAVAAGKNSEDEGMRLCADWLKSFVTEVPVEWIPAGDPFWRP
jgi:hypothetical protein